MKRLFPRMLSEAIAGSVIGLALLGAAACSPKNDVKAGAPVLLQFSIVSPAGAYTNVTDTTGDCPAGITDGGDCDPNSVSVCRLTPSAGDGGAATGGPTICHCDAKMMGDMTIMPEDPNTTGTATCSYDPRSMVFATFDRILGTAPFDMGDGTMGIKPDVVALVVDPANTMAGVGADYIPNGSDVTSLVFNPNGYGDPAGPTLVFTGQPAYPSGSNVTLTLQKSFVQGKDKTPFVGKGGLLTAGAIQFQTAAFNAGIDVPQPPTDADGGAGTTVPPMMQAVTITFGSPVDPAAIVTHIKVTSNGTDITADMTIDASGAPAVTVTPKTTWPANATIVVTVDADAADVTGVKLGAAATGTFMTGAM